MKNNEFARLMLSGNTSPSGKQNQSVNIVSIKDKDTGLIDARYYLHSNLIASLDASNKLTLNWCGWYTPTTANHMDHVLNALGVSKKVSYSRDRDARIATRAYQKDNIRGWILVNVDDSDNVGMR